MPRKSQHIVPNGEKWSVKRAGAERATKNFSTQKEAIEYGRNVAINQSAELVIHGTNGKIRNSNSFGNDPCPPVDKK